MKKSYSVLFFAMSIAGLILLTSCVPNPRVDVAGVQIEPKIDLHVVGSPGSKKLKVITPGSANCKAANPAKGCVAVLKRDTALITFNLKTSPDWYFSELKICQGETKAAMTACSLEFRQRADFQVKFAGAPTDLFPSELGIVALTGSSNKISEFTLDDYNVIEKDYFYAIQVCNTDPSVDCIWTDPPMENRGRR